MAQEAYLGDVSETCEATEGTAGDIFVSLRLRSSQAAPTL